MFLEVVATFYNNGIKFWCILQFPFFIFLFLFHAYQADILKDQLLKKWKIFKGKMKMKSLRFEK